MTRANLETLGTPCLILDQSRLERNLTRMAAWVASRGVRLRPHLKTAKCIEVARRAAPGRDAPVAVSTLLEAEHFFGHGFTDIFYAVGLGPGKLARAAELSRRGAELITMVDGVAAATAVSSAVANERVAFRTVIEIDCGEHRGGLSPDSAELVPTARALGACFAGIATHGGQSYNARSSDELAAVCLAEALTARKAVDQLASEGLRSEIVSIGSSPTALGSVDLSGVTEMRAGVYMFWDMMQAGIGVCSRDDLALSVLAEVISRPSDRSEFLIDAGAFALSKDLSTSVLPAEHNVGYGLVCDLDGLVLPDLMVKRVWQEHGLVVSTRPLARGAFPIGTRVRVLPNHACPTAALHSRYHVVNGGRAVTAEWLRINGW